MSICLVNTIQAATATLLLAEIAGMPMDSMVWYGMVWYGMSMVSSQWQPVVSSVNAGRSQSYNKHWCNIHLLHGHGICTKECVFTFEKGIS